MIPDMPPHSYTCLAEVVQTEALRGTDDEYAVAASVLNRVASPDFADTVCAVVYSKGQYEGYLIILHLKQIQSWFLNSNLLKVN